MTGTLAVSADGTNAIACLAASNASATGNTGGNNTASINIDSTAPTLTVPASPFVVPATALLGAQLSSYSVSVSDADDTPSLACTPPARTLLPIGDTTVSCHATDRAGNVTSSQFVVRVQPLPPPSASFASITSAGPTATVTVICNGVPGQLCDGTMTATAHEIFRRGHVISASAAAKATSRTVVVASAPLSVAVGPGVPLSIVLNAAAREVLGKLDSLPATLALPDGVTQRITFAYPFVTALPDSSWDTWTWLNEPCGFCYTEVDTAAFFGIPRGARLLPTAKVNLRCAGVGCPAPRSFGPGRRSVSLDSVFAGRRLGPGAVIELVITAPNVVGRVITWTTVAGNRPRQTVRCLPPGTRKPVVCAGAA
jgi:hypothetical protein